MFLVANGLLIGLAGASGLGRIIAHEVVGISPADPTTIVSTSIVLGGVALLASFIPARRPLALGHRVACSHTSRSASA
jgi:putative ABC transport system permease protein